MITAKKATNEIESKQVEAWIKIVLSKKIY